MKEGDLQIPTKELTVELALVTGHREHGSFFLAEQHKHLVDYFEQAGPFVPFSAVSGSRFLVGRTQLLWASIDLVNGRLPVEESDGGEDVLYDCRVDVDVRLTDGAKLTGELLYSPLKGGGRRASDYVNQTTSFLKLWTSEKLRIINKAHIAIIIELDGGAELRRDTSSLSED